MSAPVPALRGARLSAALLGLAVAATTLFCGGAASALDRSSAAFALTASEARAATDASVTATVTTEGAGVLGPGQDLVAAVTVNNPTDLAYTSGSVSIWLDPSPQASRAKLTSWLSSSDPVSDRIPLGEAPLSQTTLEPGSSTVVRITVPAAAVPFAARPSSAVFGIGAEVDAGQAVADTRGSVVWIPGGPVTRTDVGVVMPIVSPATADGLISAQDLATYTAPNGVLTRDVDGIVNHSAVTVGIDPMIIASIRALGNAAPATAVDWLNRLSLLPNETFSLGYGDADAAGQLQAGLPAPLTATALGYALDPQNFTPAPTPIGEPANRSRAPTTTPGPTPTPKGGFELPTLDDLLAWDFSLTGIAWPGDKTLRNSDLGPLAAAGLSTVIASGSNTNADKLDSTPNALLRAGNSSVAAFDQRISDALRQAVSAPSDLAWNAAMSKLNAQLQLVSAEGAAPRRLLVALDRSWPSSGTQLQRTLDSLFGSAWSTPASFTSLLEAGQSADLALVDAPESETRIDGIQALLRDEASLDQFSSILTDPTTLTGRTRAQLLTLLAVSWHNPRTDWSAAVIKSQEATSNTLNAVRIVPTESINLVSAQGSIPFTVINGLPNEDVTVVLSASPSNSRLEIDQPTTKTIPKDSRATILVPVKAKVGNGQVLLSLQLYSPTGVAIGEPTSATVDVHADWEGIGALIFGILLVLLFGFGIVRNILLRRDQRRRAREVLDADQPRDNDTSHNTSQGATDDPAEKPTTRGSADG